MRYDGKMFLTKKIIAIYSELDLRYSGICLYFFLPFIEIAKDLIKIYDIKNWFL